jgi:hypothetical protein
VLPGKFFKIIICRLWPIAICLCFLCRVSDAQSFSLPEYRKTQSFSFKQVHNMVIVPVMINGKGPFNFILDTGVGIMLITDVKLIDSVKITNTHKIKITGLGAGGDFEALVTPEINVEVDGIKSEGVSAAVLMQDYFNLSGYVGMQVHGLLGYEFFNKLAVNIKFSDSTITVTRPENFKAPRRSQKIPLNIEEKKPYMQALVTFPDGRKVPNKLIVDLGAGHPLSLENLIQTNGLPKKFINANLGVALNGPITGYISRMKEIEIGKYKVKDVITSFPDIEYAKRLYNIQRDGNIGIGLLKRFDVTFDYTNAAMYLRPNQNQHEPFEHDMSGLEYYTAGENFDHLVVSRVEPGSPGDESGLAKDDEIVSINFKPVSQMSIEDVDNIFKSRSERTLLLDVYHDKRYDRVILTLKRRI